MNTQEYISSGIVESYVLGLATPEERAEFEQMSQKYAEVRAARESFELTLENHGMQNAVPPPAHLKEKIRSQLNFDQPDQNRTTQPVKETAPVVKIGWLKYAVAASIILLAGSLYWNMSLQRQNNEMRTELSKTQQELGSAKNALAEIQQDANKMVGGNIKMAALTGTDISPNSTATVYWDTTSKDVYLLVNNLPKPASNEQYQLWALLDGQPIDMGLLTITEKPLQLYKMKNAQNAQAFAITLEKKGGNPTPQGKMYVLGKL